MSHIEARHATVRRLLTSRSVQTWPVSFPDLSGQWVFLQCRQKDNPIYLRRSRKQTALRKRQREGQRAKARAGRGLQPQRGQKKHHKTRGGGWRGGGAWRACVRERLRARRWGSVSLAELATEYQTHKAANTEEYQRWLRAGRAATASARRSHKHSFGGKPRSAARDRSGAIKQALANRMRECAGGSVDHLMRWTADALASGCTVAETTSVARLVGRTQTGKEIAQLNREVDALDNFQEQIGAGAIAAVRHSTPELAGLPMVAIPTTIGTHIAVGAPGTDEVASAVSWAEDNNKKHRLGARLQLHWELLHSLVRGPGLLATTPRWMRATTMAPNVGWQVCACALMKESSLEGESRSSANASKNSLLSGTRSGRS